MKGLSLQEVTRETQLSYLHSSDRQDQLAAHMPVLQQLLCARLLLQGQGRLDGHLPSLKAQLLTTDTSQKIGLCPLLVNL
jgi:hypothetical protein